MNIRPIQLNWYIIIPARPSKIGPLHFFLFC
jgi:hypothetical protein